MEAGYRHVRAQVAVPGFTTYGTNETGDKKQLPENQRTDLFEPGPYARLVPRLFDHLRTQLGDDVELIHDVHERVPPILAIQMAKDLEPYRLFYLEDPFSPEDIGYFKHLRAQSSTPIAMEIGRAHV